MIRSWEEYWCPSCGHTEDIIPVKNPPKRPVITEEPQLKPTRRLIGISARESRRRYLRSPAGREASARYRRGSLYKEAHERHRQTDTYRDTQERFKKKRKIFKDLDRILDNKPPARWPWYLKILYDNGNSCARRCIYQTHNLCIIYSNINPLEPENCKHFKEE